MAINNGILRLITGCGLVASLSVIFFYCSPIYFSALCVILMLCMLAELNTMMRSWQHFFLLVLWYPIVPCLILIYFNHTEIFRPLLVYLFCIVFSFDTASYLSGKLANRFWKTHKIIPAISPGKSWEGFCGGLLAIIVTINQMIQPSSRLSTLQIFLLSVVLCTVAFAGDIFESYLKRQANLKDSGTILPGHGGILDRFDAILFAAYFFFIFKNYLISIF